MDGILLKKFQQLFGPEKEISLFCKDMEKKENLSKNMNTKRNNYFIAFLNKCTNAIDFPEMKMNRSCSRKIKFILKKHVKQKEIQIVD